MELIILALIFLILGPVTSQWGADSGDGLDWKPWPASASALSGEEVVRRE